MPITMERLLRSPEIVDVLQFLDWSELGRLHCTLRLERSPLRTLFDIDPAAVAREAEGAAKPRKYGRLKLHEVIGKAPAEVVEVVLAAHPSAAQARDQLGRIPLFYAATRGASARVVQALIDVYPEGVDHGRSVFALSYMASTWGAKEPVVRALQRAEMRNTGDAELEVFRELNRR